MWRILRKTKQFGQPEISRNLVIGESIADRDSANGVAKALAESHAFDVSVQKPVQTVMGNWLLMTSNNNLVIYEVVEA